ncbi:MAG: hypothetical protein WA830_08460, partial [Candidatus Sulfotelmatobacter sp.]
HIGRNLWPATKDSSDEQQGFNAVRVQRTWVQLPIHWPFACGSLFDPPGHSRDLRSADDPSL